MENKIQSRISELIEKSMLYKLKRYEKEELKSLRNGTHPFYDELKKKEKNLRKLKEIEELKAQKIKELYERNLSNASNSNPQPNNEPVSEEKKVTQVIEDMVVLGDYMKEKIEEEEKEKPEKFISVQEATKNKDDMMNNPNFIMGVLAKSLEDTGAKIAIQKESDNTAESQIQANTTLQFMINGMSSKKKFDLHFDLGEDKNIELLTNKEKQKQYNDALRKKLAREYNISEDDIIITNPKRGSYSVSVIFKNQDFFTCTKEDLMQKLKKDRNATKKDEIELGEIKDIREDFLCSAWKFTPDMLDSRGNNQDGGWGIGETRGGRPYNPPIGWKRFGLNVLGKYDGGNNNWLAYNHVDGEWAIAYHGIGRGQDQTKIRRITRLINDSCFKAGINQAYENADDLNHPGHKVGRGVYCTPTPSTAESYAGQIQIGNDNYKLAFMVRVHPKKMRIASGCPDYWVVSGSDDDIRPYGILLKKC